MSTQEWESLCDGCGKCCLVLLEDNDSGDIWETNLACRLFDSSTRRCGQYDHRHSLVPDCVNLSPGNVSELKWLPETCAYKLLDEGLPLEQWHPLISGEPESVVKAGIAVSSRLIPETGVPAEDYEDHITEMRCSGGCDKGLG